MKIYTYLLAFVLGSFLLAGEIEAQESGPGAGSAIPEIAQTVIDKLQQFEAKTMLEAQVKIEQKRREVIRFLEGRLDVETRNGNLDGGLAIRNEIARLKALAPAEKTTKKVEGDAEIAPDDQKGTPEGEAEAHSIVGRWKFKDKDGSDLVREFTAEGKCIQYRGGRKEWTLDYTVVNRREVDVLFLGALKFRHTVRGNDTLQTMQPEAIAEREVPEAGGAGSGK